MSATPPVRPETPPDATTAAQHQLAQALQRARWSIGWERAWPSLARVLSVVGLFLVASWAGLWLMLSPIPRTIGLALFVIALIATLYPFIRFRWPSREEGLARLDHGSGIRHRPATALTDTLSSQDPLARALWLVQRERTLASMKRIRAGLPSPRLPRHDPWALRALVLVLLVATWFAASGERGTRIMAAFDWNGVIAPSNVRVDAWVNPPPYTAKPPIILSAANKDANSADAGAMAVPSGSTLIVRSSGGALDVALTGGLTETAPAGDAPAGTNEKHYSISGDGTAQVRSPKGQPVWTFAATGDRAPTISLAKDPERQAKGSLLLAYKLDDDYGVTEAHAQFAVRPGDDKAAKPRPLFDPPSFALVLPNARTRNGVGQTVKDLSDDPYAGAEVTLTLTAKDEAGNEGRSEAIATRLPERLFTKPLPRALIEQRRNLALDANYKDLVVAALEALMIAPEAFTPEAGHYLGLRSVLSQVQHARTDAALKDLVASLWSLAVTIEDGDITDVDKALKAAQDALKQALERGASDEEIKKLTENLRAALDKFLKQLAEQMKQNPQQLARPLDKNTKVMRQQDLNNMIERMERLSRSGDKDAAKQLLEQMQQMLENLQMAQPGQGGDDEMQQSMNELGDMIRKQQQLRDKTFKEGQDQRGERRRGQQGEKGMGDLQQDQQNLRERLKKLQEQLARQGMGQGQKGQKGQQGQQGQGQQGQQGQGEQGQNGDGQDGDGDGLGDADGAMGDAGGQLGEGDANGAVGSQGRALEALRKGAQNLAQQMQQGEGEGGQDGPGNNPGRQQGAARNSDPLGRPLRGRDFGDDLSVKIPGEIDVQRVRRILEELRRRLGDTTRPQLELDYIERLLKDY